MKDRFYFEIGNKLEIVLHNKRCNVSIQKILSPEKFIVDWENGGDDQNSEECSIMYQGKTYLGFLQKEKNETSQCCFCQGECNPSSQACGSCARSLSWSGFT